MYTVYLLKSTKKKWYYVGLTKDLENRINRHNQGRVKTTRPYSPFTLIYTKRFTHRVQARDYEKFLKVRSNKEKLIKSLENIK